MQDHILNAIANGDLNTGNISFDNIREFRRQLMGVHEQLGHGRNVLTSCDQLDQYLHSYGNMVSDQWDTFLEKAAFHNDCSVSSVRVVSYGCGQGLEISKLLDQIVIGDLQTGVPLKYIIKQIVLVETSPLALARACGIVKTYCPNSEVFTVQKDLDSLDTHELRLSSEDTTIHIFSNILDIPTFDSFDLFIKMLQTHGRHIVLAVSHHRDFEGGSSRLRDLEHALTDSSLQPWLRIERSDIEAFNLSNGMPAISWELMLEVNAQ